MNWLKSAFSRGEADRDTRNAEERARFEQEERDLFELHQLLKGAKSILKSKGVQLHYEKLTKDAEAPSIILFQTVTRRFFKGDIGGKCVVVQGARRWAIEATLRYYPKSAWDSIENSSFMTWGYLPKSPAEAAEFLIYSLGADKLDWVSPHELVGYEFFGDDIRKSFFWKLLYS